MSPVIKWLSIFVKCVNVFVTVCLCLRCHGLGLWCLWVVCRYW